jgi:hypothetical protein
MEGVRPCFFHSEFTQNMARFQKDRKTGSAAYVKLISVGEGHFDKLVHKSTELFNINVESLIKRTHKEYVIFVCLHISSPKLLRIQLNLAFRNLHDEL